MFYNYLSSFIIIFRTPLEIAFLNERNKAGRVLRKAGSEINQEFIKKLELKERQRFNQFGL